MTKNDKALYQMDLGFIQPNKRMNAYTESELIKIDKLEDLLIQQFKDDERKYQLETERRIKEKVERARMGAGHAKI